MKKVLILTASTGGGHNRAARAVQEELINIGIESTIIDALKFSGKMVDVMVSKGYEKSALYTPKAYGGMYRITDTEIMRKGIDTNILLRFLKIRLKKLIKEEAPDLIIGTHPFPVQAISMLKMNQWTSIPLLSIITDYGIHGAHVAKSVDAYIVGDAYIKSILLKEGVPEQRVFDYGIPIESRFLDPVDTLPIKEKLQLMDEFTCLLMGGSFGAGNMIQVLENLLAVSAPMQIIIVCGRNKSLYHKIEEYLADHVPNKKVALLGFTHEMNALMQIVDCIITKPGGLTITEAILKEVPLIVPFFIPGQEKDNLDFLLNNGFAIRPSKMHSLDVVIQTVIHHPEKLASIRSNMAKLKPTQSSIKIAKLVKQMIGQ